MDSIVTKDLCKKYGDKMVVKNLNLCIKDGEIFGLLGVNGAGKTTTIKMLSCLIKPFSGDAFLLGNSINTDSFKIKEIINVSPQETAVAPNLTVIENLEFLGSLYHKDKEVLKTNINKMVEEFHLEEVLKKKAKTLSGGWQRKLSIALALISNPKILFLDEPTLGLDVIARHELWTIIQSLKGKCTVILTTHYLEEAEKLCSHIAIMANGELKGLGTAMELKEKANTTDFEEAFVKIAGGEMNELN